MLQVPGSYINVQSSTVRALRSVMFTSFRPVLFVSLITVVSFDVVEVGEGVSDLVVVEVVFDEDDEVTDIKNGFAVDLSERSCTMSKNQHSTCNSKYMPTIM